MTAFIRFLKGQPFLAKLRFGQCSIFVYRLHFLFDGVSVRFRMAEASAMSFARLYLS
jgi:hypothetical protein